MQSRGVAATFLGPIESLRYFTGLVWQPSERLLGALVTEDRLTYIVPGFERSRVESLPHLPGDILSWEEDESSAALVAGLIPPSGILALDDAIELSFYHAFAGQMGAARLVDGGGMLNALRMIKSPAEIAPDPVCDEHHAGDPAQGSRHDRARHRRLRGLPFHRPAASSLAPTMDRPSGSCRSDLPPPCHMAPMASRSFLRETSSSSIPAAASTAITPT
ncbi:hypothetical protein FHT97_005079 [Rhizobium sp. BK399]|nr:hypothetical protein [Rhizobium sp. BK399]